MLNNKKGFVKHVNSKRRPKKTTGPIIAEVGPLTNRNTEKLKVFSAFFLPSALNNTGNTSELKDHNCRNSDSPFVHRNFKGPAVSPDCP